MMRGDEIYEGMRVDEIDEEMRCDVIDEGMRGDEINAVPDPGLWLSNSLWAHTLAERSLQAVPHL